TEYNGKNHSEENSRTDCLTACRPRSACQYHRKHTQHESKGSHQDRTETKLGGMNGRLYQVSPVIYLHLCKLYDKDGILRRKSHEHYQTNLEVDIILQPTDGNTQIGS